MRPRTEHRLWRQDSERTAAEGEPSYVGRSFESFYATQFSLVMTSVVPVIGSWAVAQEITQEAFVEAYRRWDTVAAYERPDLWVRRAAMNRAISSIRRRAAERRAFRRYGSDEPAVPSIDNVGYSHLLRHISELPSRQSAAVSLVYLGDLDIDEAAEVMGCTQSTVRSHLERARNQLQAILREEHE